MEIKVNLIGHVVKRKLFVQGWNNGSLEETASDKDDTN